MQWRIGFQNEARRSPRFGAPEIVDAHAGGRTERFPIAECRLHLRIARARPEPITLQPDDGPGFAQLRVEGIGRGEEVVGEGVDERDREGGRHLTDVLSMGYRTSPSAI